MLSKTDNNIILNINNLGIVDFEFLFTALYGHAPANKKQLKYKLRKRLDKLKSMCLIEDLKSLINIRYFRLKNEAKIVLLNLKTRFNYNHLNVDSTLFVHHASLMLVIAPLVFHYDCFYRTEYMLRDILKGSNMPDFIALINNRKFIFEVERSQKAEELIGGKLSAYNIEFKNDFIIYVTESQSLADKINKMKHAYSNVSRIHAIEINFFINNTQAIIDDILSKDTTKGALNVH